jgi:hypothetical protein
MTLFLNQNATVFFKRRTPHNRAYESTFTGLLNPEGFMASTEHVSWSKIASAVLPMITPDIPVRATVPMTTRSARNSAANGAITFFAGPSGR